MGSLSGVDAVGSTALFSKETGFIGGIADAIMVMGWRRRKIRMRGLQMFFRDIDCDSLVWRRRESIWVSCRIDMRHYFYASNCLHRPGSVRRQARSIVATIRDDRISGDRLAGSEKKKPLARLLPTDKQDQLNGWKWGRCWFHPSHTHSTPQTDQFSPPCPKITESPVS